MLFYTRMFMVRLGLIAALLFGFLLPAAPAAGYPTSHVLLEGHGWGHGRGMGQYGALGYAVNQGWQYPQILDHFYGGTTAGSVPNDDITVQMLSQDGKDTIVTQERGHLMTNVDGGAARYTALYAEKIGPNLFRVNSGPGCAGPWTPIAENFSGPVHFKPETQNDDRLEMLQICEPTGTRWLRGELHAIDDDGRHITVNRLLIERYLRGVVPRESPASWGELGGGAGMHALRAQAVAARSYARASSWNPPHADTCDTTACQVYLGRAIQDSAGFRDLEDPKTDSAVAETAGEVRTKNGVPARTEFSSSTGGHTAGGAFPAVPDAGDSIDLNCRHIWRAQIPVSRIESAYPEIGQLVNVVVTSRNGLGDWGGRVLRIRLDGTSASKTVNGDLFRSTLRENDARCRDTFGGLLSDWFRIVFPGGYWIAGSDGAVVTFGNAPFHGSMGGQRLNAPVIAMSATPTRNGYWLLASDGGIFSFGDARFYGSTGNIRLNQPVIGMGPTPSSNGYWFVATDGGIFSFGDAVFHGSTGNIRLNQPVVGMAATPSGNGYWLVASDGGIFAFGDAAFHGSTGSIKLNQPIVGMAATPSGNGYWLVASDGGIFAFGDAPFHGSTGSIKLNQPIVSMAATASGAGYYLLARDGGIFAFGDAMFFGSPPGSYPSWTATKVGMALSHSE